MEFFGFPVTFEILKTITFSIWLVGNMYIGYEEPRTTVHCLIKCRWTSQFSWCQRLLWRIMTFPTGHHSPEWVVDMNLIFREHGLHRIGRRAVIPSAGLLPVSKNTIKIDLLNPKASTEMGIHNRLPRSAIQLFAGYKLRVYSRQELSRSQLTSSGERWAGDAWSTAVRSVQHSVWVLLFSVEDRECGGTNSC